MAARIIADRYELLHRIGSGAMASVYLAQDLRQDRKVAIKLLMTVDGDQEALYYFQREARAAAALRHPGIVQVFGYSPPDEAPAYIAMEAVDGVTLQEVIDEHSPLPEDAILALLQQVSAGLAYAHGQGVIHRDIKPGNVMVGYSGRVCLSDFGLAKAYVDPEMLGPTVAGRVTGLAGTPAYMAPEQVLAQETSPASDIFSLGCLAYAMVTGHSPFADPDLLETYRAVSEAKFDPVDEVRAGLSDHIVALVHDCLLEDPRERPTAAKVNSATRNAHRAGKHPAPVTSITRLLASSAADATMPAAGHRRASARVTKASEEDTDRSAVPNFGVDEEPRQQGPDSGDGFDPTDFETARTTPDGYDRLDRTDEIEPDATLAPTAIMTRPDLLPGASSEVVSFAIWVAAAAAIATLLVAVAWCL